MQKTFASFSFGCRVNQAEKEELDRQLLTLGFSYDQNNPSLYLINTCAVTKKAEREARQMIYQLKRRLPDTKIVVTGCAATRWINDKVSIRQADYIIDNTNKEFAAHLLAKKLEDRKGPKVSIVETGAQSGLPDKFLASGRFFLKIQDGCQRFCTFCIVPYLRGQPKSKSIHYIVNSIKGLEKGIKEIALVAINTQAYGLDTGESFINLVQTILDQTSIPRLSFGSIHPWSITEEFFSFYKRILPQNRLVNFFHIPLQSGNNKMLAYMKRGYTREEFTEKLKRLKEIYPLAFIGTDIIVGFLEETETDFADTYQFLHDSPISKFHVFRFSPREKTAAYFMRKRLKEPTPAEKSKRAKALIDLSNKKYRAFLDKHIGQTFSALFLEQRTDDYQSVLLSNQIPALVKTEKNLTGEIHQVKIDCLRDEKLVGRIH